ncbi:uncharacterized protein LOC132194903 [Neocloeon triangulifer]|uniref:uncharacterized protein LOC132194903 n=1 Tax=Neocloeon triangulifer TaxID=2078957 RepID=UPI00286EB749|nr:uncharacterized protein LOC132194903 [Neocloeon triangulifer]
MKCLGEDKKIFMGGKLNAGETLRMMEIATQDTPDQMEKGFNGFSQCSSQTGVDECAVAAASYDCGVEKIPDITKKMVANGKGSPVELIPSVPCVPARNCITDSLPCVVNQTLVDQIANTNQTSIGHMRTSKYQNRRFFMSNYITFNVSTAHQYCCSIGMRLMEFDTFEDMQETAASVRQLGLVNNYVVLSEVMSVDSTTEVWCGSRRRINATLYGPSFGLSPPALSCTPQIYFMHASYTNYGAYSPAAGLLLASDVPVVAYFVCANN